MPRTTHDAWRALALLILLAQFFPVSVRGEFETPTVITGVTVIQADGTVLENASIVMEDGRITAVGVDVTKPAGAELIDGAGLFAYPAFIDAHSHLGIPDATRTAEERQRKEDVNPDLREAVLPSMHKAGRRGIRPELRAIELFVPDEKVLAAHRAAGFAAAVIAPRDGIFGGTSDVVELAGTPIRDSVLATDVGMHASSATGEDGDYPQTLLGVFAQFRQALLDARWYARMQKYAERHPTSSELAPVDSALDALQPLLARRQRMFFEANSENEIRRALDLAAEFNLSIGITGGREAWKLADRLAAERVPVILSLKFDEEPEYGRTKQADTPKPKEGELASKPGDAPAAASSSAEVVDTKKGTEGSDAAKQSASRFEPLKVRQERRRLWEEQVGNAIRLNEKGVSFALRSRDLTSPNELFIALRKVMERGLPEPAAVAALTIKPAEMLGLRNQIGDIAEGHLADVVLLTGRLADEKARAKHVFIRGKKFTFDDVELPKKEPTETATGKKDSPGGAGEGTPPDAAQAEAKGAVETGSVAATPTAGERIAEVPADAPTFESEIDADRVPRIHTGGNLLIRNATLLPVTAPRREGSILIRDGEIAAVGDVAEVPSGVTEIDGTGLFVMPGIIDCHSHLGIDGVNEAAHSISAEVRIADTIDPYDLAIYRAAAGGATIHHAMHGSANTIGGQCVVFKLKYRRPVGELLMPAAPRTIKFALGENVTQANFFNVYGKRFPNTRLGVEATVRAAFEAAGDYRREWDRYEAGLAAGKDLPPPRQDLKLDALSDVLSGRITVHCHCYRSDEILRLIDVAEEYGVRIGVWHHVLEGYRIAPEIFRHGSGASTFANMWAYKIEAYGALPHNAAMMTYAGICTTVNSDSANTIRYLNQEAAKCIRWGGLDETEALKLITLNGATQLQIANRVGSLDVGKDGNLSIFNGHPLNTFSRNVMTVIDGEVVFEDRHTDRAAEADVLAVPAKVNREIPATDHRAYAIVGATVHTMSGPPIDDATVVVIEDKIHAVGADVPVPPGAGVIDGRGLHVYPGLIDAGSELGLNEIDMVRSTRDFAEIGIFNPELIAATAVHPHSAHIRVARSTGITTALARPAGGRISGQSSIIHLDGWTAPEMLIERAYGLHVSVPYLPYDPAEQATSLLTSRLRGVACCMGGPDEHAHDEFDQLRGGPEEERKKRRDDHKKSMRELEDYLDLATRYADRKDAAATDSSMTFERDLPLDALIPYVRGEKPIIFSAGAYKHILDTIEFAEKRKLKCVLYGGDEAWKLAQELAEKNIPVILRTPYGYPSGQFEPWDAVYRCASVLDQAGVRYCFASDSSSDAYNLGTEVGMAVAHGLPRERAEYALTLGAAEILGIADRVGSIEVGKRADLIVTTGSPLQTVTQVTHMFIDGRPVELTSIHTESYDKFSHRPAPVLPPEKDLRGPARMSPR